MSAQAFVESYKGSHPFLLSLKEFLDKHGCLTPRQEEAALKFAKPKVLRIEEFSYRPGDRFEITTWLAKKLAVELGQEFIFRNFEVVSVQAETGKALQMIVRFMSMPGVNCHVCGRDLHNAISRATGIGPICAERMGIDRGTYEDAEATLAIIAQSCAKIGDMGPLWFAKSQMTKI